MISEKSVYKRKPRWYNGPHKYFGILSRYQHWSSDGIVWTKWFVYDRNEFETEEDAKVVVKKLTKEDDKKMKLKHEFKIASPKELDEICYDWCEFKC